jgi:hypothetical protein
MGLSPGIQDRLKLPLLRLQLLLVSKELRRENQFRTPVGVFEIFRLDESVTEIDEPRVGARRGVLRVEMTNRELVSEPLHLEKAALYRERNLDFEQTVAIRRHILLFRTFERELALRIGDRVAERIEEDEP